MPLSPLVCFLDSDFRPDELQKPMTGDLAWSAPTLSTLNPIGSPIAHAGLP